MSIELLVQNNVTGDVYDISDLIEGEINWETQRNSASKLDFRVVKDKQVDFSEGSIVRFKYNGENVFYGYIFTKSRNKDQIISVTAYDQLRYLKNKDTYVFTGKKASDVLNKISYDFKLKTGTIEDTKYIIPSMIEENQTLIDIILKAVDLTLISNNKMYVLFDNYGAIELRNVEGLKTDFVIDGNSNLQDFDYQSTIDDETANQVKLVQNNKTTGKRDVYIVKDSSNISKWGLLQLYDVVDEGLNAAQITDRANKSLSLYNRVFRTLSIPVLGDIRARASYSIFVSDLNLGDIILNQYMLVDKASHTFRNNDHSMKLDLRIV
jgi:hypothetical protein